LLTPNGALPTSNGAFRCLVQLLSADNEASSDRAELYFSMSRRPRSRRCIEGCSHCASSRSMRSSRAARQCAPNRPPPPLLPARAAATLFTADDVMARCIQPPSTRFSPRWTGEESATSAHYSRAVADESRASPPTLYRRRANTLSTLRSGSAGQASPGARRADIRGSLPWY
jgi:hypothetical protein